MNGERPPDPQLPDPHSPDPHLPETLTRLLRAPKSAIWPTPEDRNRLRLGRQRPRQPSRAILGVWLWAILYNLIGLAILAALWRTML